MIPEAAVEAAMLAFDPSWDTVPAEWRDYFLRRTRTALEAAAPHLLAELRSHVADQILAANNTEGFTEFAAGWVAALKNVDERLTK